MSKNLEAVLIGGPHNGQITNVDDAPTQITIVSRMMERTAEMREVCRATYKLVSNEKAMPLRYEFYDSN